MSVGMVVLSAVAVLIFFGVLQRVLDRMYLTDRMALFLVAAMFVGTLLPPLDLGFAAVNIGGALIPLGICMYLWIKADEAKERWRALIGSVLTAGAIFGLSVWLPDEPEAMWMDPNLIYGCAGGVIAWLLGRSRRAAFICGITGVVLADIVTAVLNWRQGIDQKLVLGGAGIADTVVISGVLAVLLAELVGEITERIVRRRQKGEAK